MSSANPTYQPSDQILQGYAKRCTWNTVEYGHPLGQNNCPD